MLAYRGKRRQIVKVLRYTNTGAVAQYEPVNEPGSRYMPLVIDGENIESFEPVKDRQLLLFQDEARIGGADAEGN